MKRKNSLSTCQIEATLLDCKRIKFHKPPNQANKPLIAPLLANCLQFLKFKDLFLRVQFVSKHFHETVWTSKHLWNHAHIKLDEIPDLCFKSVIERVGRWIRHIIITKRVYRDNIDLFMKQCEAEQLLSVRILSIGPTLLILNHARTFATLVDSLRAIHAKCSTIRELYFRGIVRDNTLEITVEKNISTLNGLHLVGHISESLLKIIARQGVNLRNLVLRGHFPDSIAPPENNNYSSSFGCATSVTNLRSLEVGGSNLGSSVLRYIMGPSLRRLVLDGDCDISAIQLIVQRCPDLQYLDITNVTPIETGEKNVNFNYTLLDGLTKLEEYNANKEQLDLSWIKAPIQKLCVHRLLANPPLQDFLLPVRKLTVHTFTERAIKFILDSFSHLEHLVMAIPFVSVDVLNSISKYDTKNQLKQLEITTSKNVHIRGEFKYSQQGDCIPGRLIVNEGLQVLNIWNHRNYFESFTAIMFFYAFPNACIYFNGKQLNSLDHFYDSILQCRYFDDIADKELATRTLEKIVQKYIIMEKLVLSKEHEARMLAEIEQKYMSSGDVELENKLLTRFVYAFCENIHSFSSVYSMSEMETRSYMSDDDRSSLWDYEMESEHLLLHSHSGSEDDHSNSGSVL